MIDDKEQEKEILGDLDFLWKCYRDKLDQGKSIVSELNVVIRALKHVHRYFNNEDGEEIEPIIKKP